ncbi:MAG: hypothetical protein RIQ81_186 [Pseudomonadota bacterium]
MPTRITYTTAYTPEELNAINSSFDAEVTKHTNSLGREFPALIGYQNRTGSTFNFDSVNPSRTTQALHRFGELPVAALDEMVALANKAQKSWGALPWHDRVTMMRKAADVIRERKMTLAAAVCMETGKNRMEALGDVEESSDLIDYYATQLEMADGFYQPLASLLPGEVTGSWLRPYGVFTVIAPFNFPVALAAGMAGAAMLGGNSVILKPSEDTPWSGELLLQVMRDAGIPEGVFQLCQGRGSVVGNALVRHDGIAGVAFTGSVKTGMAIHNICASGRWIKPCLMELGGKNGVIIMPGANLDDAATGSIKSAFGLSGQKCSALSRIIVHQDIKDALIERLAAVAQTWVVAEATRHECSLGPVINAASVARAERSAALAATSGGRIIYRHQNVATDNPAGHYVMPVLAELPPSHELMQQELFLPFAGITAVRSFEEAISVLNNTDFGLTAGIFSGDDREVERFFEEAEAGVLYANRKTGATTGAWPGVQSFCGWKASGGSGKGGCGPWYVSQFMREQSRTWMK